MTSPRPWQVGQVRSIEKKPCAARTRPWPSQVGQAFGLEPGLAPVPEQVSQVTLVGTRISAVLPAIGLLEGDLHVVAQVGAALAAADAAGAAAAAAHELAEDVVEDVGHRRGEIGVEAARAVAAVLEGGMAEAVIGGALLRVLAGPRRPR